MNGAFALPTGELDVQLKDGEKVYWKNVACTDWVDKGEIAETVEVWSRNHEVLAVRFNGRELQIPTNYHWELEYKGEVLGTFATRKDAVEEMNARKIERYKDKTVKVGIPKFVQD